MRRTRAGIAAALLVLVTVGCSDDQASQGAPSSPRATATIQVSSQPLPADLAGSFVLTGEADRWSFYAAGDAFCRDEVDTTSSCYAVRVGADPSAAPVELGSLQVEGQLLRMTVVKDPKPGCVGTTNQVRWEKTADGVLLTPVDDCHGTLAIRLARS